MSFIFSNKIKGFKNIKYPKLPFDFNFLSPKYTGIDVSKNDFVNDKEVLAYYKNLCVSNQGKENLILSDLINCKKRYTDFLKNIFVDLETIDEFMNCRLPSYLKDFWKENFDLQVLEYDFKRHYPDVDEDAIDDKTKENLAILDKINGTIFFEIKDLSGFDKKLWKKCGGKISKCAGDINLLNINGKDYDKFIGSALKDKATLNFYSLISMVEIYSQAEELRKGAEEFLNDYLNPFIEQLDDTSSSSNNSTVDMPAEETPVVDNDNEYKDKPYYSKLADAFVCFPEFRKDLPVMLEKGIIKEDENHKDKLKWRKSNIAFAQYFFIRKSDVIDWDVLIELFTRQDGKYFDDFNLKSQLSNSLLKSEETEPKELDPQKLARDAKLIFKTLKIKY